MGIDDTKYALPASQGAVGRTTINTVVALQALRAMIDAIKDGKKPSAEDIESYDQAIERLQNHFNALSGWTDE